MCIIQKILKNIASFQLKYYFIRTLKLILTIFNKTGMLTLLLLLLFMCVFNATFNTKTTKNSNSNFQFFFYFLENVQIVDGNVIICKNALFGKCNSSINYIKCKYYHVPEDILSMQIFNHQIKYQQKQLEQNYYY